jgi:DNA-binding MarR family transcriptional regulator
MRKPYYRNDNYVVHNSLGYLIRRSRNLISQEVERLLSETSGGQGITLPQWIVLMCLRDQVARTPAELCQNICYDSGAFTRLIDQMEKRDLVRRSRSTRDRRVIELHLTEQGLKTIEMTMGTVVGFFNGLLINFSEEEADTLIKLLSRLVSNLTENRKRGS